MLNWSQRPAVNCCPDRASSAWVLRGNWLPLKALVEYLESGASIHEFLNHFSGFAQEQADVVLDHATPSPLVA
jgi:hypothetical protein